MAGVQDCNFYGAKIVALARTELVCGIVLVFPTKLSTIYLVHQQGYDRLRLHTAQYLLPFQVQKIEAQSAKLS